MPTPPFRLPSFVGVVILRLLNSDLFKRMVLALEDVIKGGGGRLYYGKFGVAIVHWSGSRDVLADICLPGDSFSRYRHLEDHWINVDLSAVAQVLRVLMKDGDDLFMVDVNNSPGAVLIFENPTSVTTFRKFTPVA